MRVEKIDVILETGFAGATHNDIIEVEIPDDATPEEILEIKEETSREWAFNIISVSWIDVKS